MRGIARENPEKYLGEFLEKKVMELLWKFSLNFLEIFLRNGLSNGTFSEAPEKFEIHDFSEQLSRNSSDKLFQFFPRIPLMFLLGLGSSRKFTFYTAVHN